MGLTRVKNPMVDVPSQTEITRAVAGTDTCTTADQVLFLSGASFTQTLYTAVGNAGRILTLIHGGTSLTQVYTIDPHSSETIDGVSSKAMYTYGEVLRLISDGSNWRILSHRAETEWTDAGVITISATTTAPTKNNSVATDKIWWRRHAGDAEVRMYYRQSATGSGGTAGSGDYLFGMPSGLSIDTSRVTAQTVVIGSSFYAGNEGAVGNYHASSSSVSSSGVVTVYDADYVRLVGAMTASASGGGGALGSGRTPAMGNVLVSYSAVFRVPIVGW